MQCECMSLYLWPGELTLVECERFEVAESLAVN